MSQTQHQAADQIQFNPHVAPEGETIWESLILTNKWYMPGKGAQRALPTTAHTDTDKHIPPTPTPDLTCPVHNAVILAHNKTAKLKKNKLSSAEDGLW